MRSLKSRPTKKLIWSNFFYLEGEGNLSSDAGEEMLKRLSAVCSGLKVLGSFDREVYLED
jgi:prephenate dehydratase